MAFQYLHGYFQRTRITQNTVLPLLLRHSFDSVGWLVDRLFRFLSSFDTDVYIWLRTPCSTFFTAFTYATHTPLLISHTIILRGFKLFCFCCRRMKHVAHTSLLQFAQTKQIRKLIIINIILYTQYTPFSVRFCVLFA